MYAFRCSDAGEGEDLEEWSLPTLLTFELAWSPEMVRRGHEKSPHCPILSPPRQPVLWENLMSQEPYPNPMMHP